MSSERPLSDALDRLRLNHAGAILTPMDAGYEKHRRNFLATFDHVCPQLIARCTSSFDVRAAVQFANRQGMPVAVRSGGHCFAGFSLCEGLVVDLELVNDIVVGDDTIMVGAGAKLGAIADALMPRLRALPSGSCPSVGVSGQTLGGGLGILGRAHGFTCDQMISAEVVLADGSIVQCSEWEHEDLLWVLRGAGAGGFGVVTWLTLKTVEAPDMTSFYLVWPFSDAVPILEMWQDQAPSAPDSLTLGLAFTAPPGAPAIVEVYGAMAASSAETNQWLDAFARKVGSPLEQDIRVFGSYRQALLHQAGLLDISGSTVAEITPSGVPRQGYRLTRSEFLAEPLPRAVMQELADIFEADRRASQYRGLELAPFGGAYNRIPREASAYVHRDAQYSLKHAILLPAAADEVERGAARSWVDRSWEVIHEHGTGGVYPNFPDPALESPLEAYYGVHLPRLAEIRRCYDPADVFAFPHAIPLAESVT